MREDLLYFIWKQNKLPKKLLCASNGDIVSIKAPGIQNRLEALIFSMQKLKWMVNCGPVMLGCT